MSTPPPLPPAHYFGSQAVPEDTPLYTADQMLAYVDAAREQDRARAAAPQVAVGVSDAQIVALRDKHGITSNGRGIKAHEQIRKFVRDVLGLRPAAADLPASGVSDRTLDVMHSVRLSLGMANPGSEWVAANFETFLLGTLRAMERALRRISPATKPEAPAREWRSEKTVADLVNNLLTLDQSLPIYGAQYIEHKGRKRAIAVPPTISSERVKDGRWIGEGEDLNSIVVWTRAAALAAPAQGAAVPKP